MQIKATHLLILISMLFMLGSISCKHDVSAVAGNGGSGNGGGSGGGTGGGTTCDTTKVYFQQQVLPILLSNCTMSGCHDVASHKEDVILTNYQYVMSTAGIRPGRPFDSEIYERIIDSDPRKRMPPSPNTSLTTQQQQLIYNWIQQGAQDLVCQDLCNTNSFTYSGAIKNIISNKCQGCHSGATPQGGIDLSTYNGVKSKADDGKLWGAINHLPGYSPMPKNGNKLSACELEQIQKWIAAGSLNN